MKKKLIALLFSLLWFICFSESSDEDINLEIAEKQIKDKKYVKEKNEEPKSEDLETVFSSMTQTNLILAENKKWYYEKYNKDKLCVLSVLYDGNELIEKKEVKYNKDNIIKEETLYNKTGSKKNVYDNNENIIKTVITRKDGKVIFESNKTYNENNNLILITVLKNDIEEKKEITYNTNGEKTTETNYKNNQKISFIEYTGINKIIHLFDNGVEISVFNEKVTK